MNSGIAFSNKMIIEISSNSEFNSSNGVVSGSGTDLDPYIIEGWNITTSSSDGINIHEYKYEYCYSLRTL